LKTLLQEKRKTFIRIGLAVAHGIFLIVATLFYLSITFTLDDEIILIQASAAVKNKLLGQKERPDTDRLLLVNVSWDKKLIPRTDSSGFVLGNQAITNRASIAKLLQVMNQKPDNHGRKTITIVKKTSCSYIIFFGRFDTCRRYFSPIFRTYF